MVTPTHSEYKEKKMTVDYQKTFFARCIEDLKIPEGWENCSWGNDACPSFYTNGYQIFIDHKDPKQREVGEETFRFHIFLEAEYGHGSGWSVSSDDLEEIIKETKISIFDRPMVYDKEEYVKQLKMWDKTTESSGHTEPKVPEGEYRLPSDEKEFNELKDSLHDLWSQMESEKIDLKTATETIGNLTKYYLNRNDLWKLLDDDKSKGE